MMAAKKGAKAASPYRPYKSYLFLTGSAASFTTDVSSAVSSAIASLDGVKNVSTMAKSIAHAVDFHSMTYVVEVEPSWHLPPAPMDVLNHVVVVAISSNWAAVCCSDASLREKIFRDARKGGGNLSPVGDRRIKDALVAGKAKTLWLSGTHRRTTVKADSKVLAGQDLGDALNPLDDQTYYFTSARMETKLSGATLTLGVSPSSSRAWVGPSRDWAEFCEGTAQLLKHLASAKKGQNPLPILAQTATSLTGVSGAFDVMIESDDTLAPTTSSTKLATDAVVTVATNVGKTVTIDARDNGGAIGTIDFELSAVDKSGLLTSKVSAVAATGLSPDRAQLFGQLTEGFQDGRRVKIYFDSGHTLADGRLVAVHFRDLPYQGYKWEKWTGFDVTREKPSSLSNIGKEDSLFDWAYEKWKQGYLCCDDGAGEMADFVSFTPGPPAIIRLIHAKGSGSAAANREVSVTDYEVVVAQALKNVRWVDRLNAAGKLADVIGKATSTLVWKDGTKIQRSVASAAFAAIGASAHREIHIVQPRLTKQRLEAARAGSATVNQLRRVQRLDALLNAADLAARSVSATLSVYVDDG